MSKKAEIVIRNPLDSGLRFRVLGDNPALAKLRYELSDEYRREQVRKRARDLRARLENSVDVRVKIRPKGTP